MTPFKRLTTALAGIALFAASACAQQRDSLPPVPPVHGPLRITVAYPAAGAALDVGDSIFLFGTVGDGDARLTVAGQPAQVAPNGAWLAWIAIPHDSSFVLALNAERGGESATASIALFRVGWVRESGAWVDRASLAPTGDVWMPAGEPLPLAVRAAPGAAVRLLLPGGAVVRLVADSIPGPVAEGVRAFDHDERNLVRVAHGDRYVGTLRDALNPGADALLPGASARPTKPAVLEVILGHDTTRTPWPLSVTRSTLAPVAVVLDDDPDRRGGTDRVTIGRAYPGGTYTWFFPQGTRTRADMRIGDQVRLRLAHETVAWVPAAEVHPAAAADDARPAVMGSPTLSLDSGRTRMRIPLSRAVPSQVEETDRGVTIRLFDAVSDANWIRYGAGQHFVRLVTPRQETADRVTLAIEFDRPPWGWRSRVDGTDLVVEFRPPPAIDSLHPLAGRRIVIDPGHPPNGACGPTGLCEPEANLAVARAARELLSAAGADVILTRNDERPVELWPRVALADSLNADVLVSIHQNALPDGLNPFTNNGTSTFFNHAPSMALARAVQDRLVAHLGLRDLGVTRGDLALVRPTWYPAILTEGLYLMFPEQEAALRSTSGQRAYAEGIVEGLAAFLRQTARDMARHRP